MQERNLQQAPVHARADVCIAGGTAAAVALALGLRKRGLSVFLCCARPYLGEDLCGEMRFWPGTGFAGESALLGALFPDAPRPSRPMHIKLTLEQALVGAGIPFLLNAHPVSVLAGPDGSGRGAILATRSGLLAVMAGMVLDETIDGMPGRIRTPPPAGKHIVLHTTLCLGEGSDAPGVEIVDRPEPFTGRINDAPYFLSARTYRLEVDFGGGSLRDLARAEAETVGRCWVPQEYQHQERVTVESARPSALASLVEAEQRAQRIEPPAASPEPLTQVPFDLGALPELDRCQVLVLGGGTAGAPAAIAAARAGADTILVESADQLGGVSTVGQITRYWFGNKTGFTCEIDEGVKRLETDPEILKSNSEWSRSAKAEWYRRQCRQAGATLLFRSLCAGVRKRGPRVDALLVAAPGAFGFIAADCIVDATGCADVAAAAGAPVRTIGADHVAFQGTGLAGMQPGRDYHNSDHNFCDDTDVADTTAFLVSSKLKFRDHFDAGQLVDSRERRQIIGEVELGPVDFLADRRYPDTICVASSNFDTHGFTIHPVFTCKPMDKRRMWADVPFRALLPRGLDNVLATGLGLSAHRDALPVIRMQADVQNHGYAAGYAAAAAARAGAGFRQLDIREVQRHLVANGTLPERVLGDTDNFPVDDALMAAAVRDQWDSHKGLALIFSDPARARPLLLQALAANPPPGQRLRYGQVLCLMGDAGGVPPVKGHLERHGWDGGWNYRGMGQFGMSLSPVDSLLIALGKAGGADAWPVLLDKAAALPGEPDFSHCRAVAEAFESLHARHPDRRAAPALAALLRRPGMTGHHQPDLATAQARLTPDTNENGVRNRSLREIHLARALYRCGDADRLGEAVLRGYGADVRAVFARHARAVLRERPA